jgi:hypothetical protein
MEMKTLGSGLSLCFRGKNQYKAELLGTSEADFLDALLVREIDEV